jgi:hypothetical protein
MRGTIGLLCGERLIITCGKAAKLVDSGLKDAKKDPARPDTLKAVLWKTQWANCIAGNQLRPPAFQMV